MTELHVIAEGPEDGASVVLSASLGSTLRMWDPQAASLVAAGYRVIRYDHRGHGASEVPAGPYELGDIGGDLVDVLDRLEIERTHLVGLSLGGMVGMWLAQHHPERIRRLVLCCTSARLGPAQLWIDRARTVRAEGTQALADAVVSRWVTPAFAEAAPDTVQWLRQMVVDTPDEGYAACCGAIERMNLLDDLPKITAPTLVIAATDDPSTPPEHGYTIAEAIPGSEFEVIGPAAHLANVEQPERVSELVINHLGGSAG